MKEGITLEHALAECRTSKTAGEIMDGLFMCTEPAEVKAYMDEYRKVSPYADANVRHMLGYYSGETRRVYRKLLGGEIPDKYDGMTREQLIARLEDK